VSENKTLGVLGVSAVRILKRRPPMFKLLDHKRLGLITLILALVIAVTWQIALAQAPAPNPLPTNPGADLTANGAAATMHGDPYSGRQLFAANCASCHGDRGTMGEDNPGSDDGTVPTLNPIDPGFLEDSQGDPAIFARDVDLFIQHGSRPSGDDPQMLMPAWGDKKLLTQSQIADVEAYVMQLNNLYWPDKWYPPAEVDVTAVRAGTLVTYTLTIVNQGGAALSNVQLQDTLPPGLAFIEGEYYGLNNNPPKVVGSTVEWSVGGVPQGGTAGPFVITTGLTGSDIPANTAQVIFDYTDYAGNVITASAVSVPAVPGGE
jgi:uncharacterized repeat protein (TIGR01451 family)